MTVNKELENELEEFLSQSLDVVNSSLSGTTRFVEISRHPQGGHEAKFVEKRAIPVKVDWTAEHSQRWNQILAKLLRSKSKYIGNPWGSYLIQAELWLMKLIAHYHDAKGDYDVDKAITSQIVDDFVTFFTKEKASVRVRAPLLGFNFEHASDIKISPDIFLRRFTDQEFTDFYSYYAGFEKVYEYRLGNLPNWILESRIEIPIYLGDHPNCGLIGEDPLNQFLESSSSFLNACKSFTSGDVCISEIDCRIVGFDPTIVPNRLFPASFCRKPFFINAAEANEFLLHLDLVKANNQPALSIALSRIADAEGRLKATDSLLDAVIGLEAILLYQCNQELKFRFALRYALLQPKTERRVAFKVASGVYDIRSKIAHGDDIRPGQTVKVSGEKLSIEQLADHARAMLRQLIRLFLEQSKMQKFKDSRYWEDLMFD